MQKRLAIIRHVNEDDNILKFNINIVVSKHFNIMGVNGNLKN